MVPSNIFLFVMHKIFLLKITRANYTNIILCLQVDAVVFMRNE